MKRFLVRVSIFFIVLTVLAVGLDFALSSFYRRSLSQGHLDIETWEDVYRGEVNAEVLVLGSSRALVHYSPKILADSLSHSVYNLGMDGSYFPAQYLIFKKQLEHNSPPLRELS